MFGVSLYMCGFVCLVDSQNLYQPFQSYSYGASYTESYGKQPIVVTPASYYNQAYIAQSPSTYPESALVSNQLQEIYLNKILSNPAIQAFIDPGTKIYNQNGVEISDQVRPRSPNVVNNYFIVPTDYLKINESRMKSSRYKNQNVYNSYPKRYLKNNKIKETKDFNEISQLDKTSKDIRNNENYGQRYTDKDVTKKYKPSQQANEIFQGTGDKTKKQRDNLKRDDKISTKQPTEKPPKKRNRGSRRSKDEPKIRYESDLYEYDKMFDIKEECCCELENRNPRNPSDEPHKIKKANQNDFMNNWMNYVKMFMPKQYNDALDFSHINFPYNIEQIPQLPNFNNIQPQVIRSNKNKKQRKQKPKEQPVSESFAKNCKTTQGKHKIVELSPKFIEVDESKEPVKMNKETKALILEVPTEISKKEANQQNQLPISSELSVEEVPNIYQNEIIDYYPDFKNDVIYTTDENDLHFINRNYYNTEEALNRERRKFDRGEDFKKLERTGEDDITKPKMEETQFRTPPGLTDPGFQTKKINMKDKAGFYSYYINDKDSTDFVPVEKDDHSVETVFARSKVVKYSRPRDIEKHKVEVDQESRTEKYRNLYPKDGDTTIVFSKAWNC